MHILIVAQQVGNLAWFRTSFGRLRLPLRGYGPIELLHALWDYLNGHNKFLILTLGEI